MGNAVLSHLENAKMKRKVVGVTPLVLKKISGVNKEYRTGKSHKQDKRRVSALFPIERGNRAALILNIRKNDQVTLRSRIQQVKRSYIVVRASGLHRILQARTPAPQKWITLFLHSSSHSSQRQERYSGE